MIPYASRTGTHRNLKALRQAGWRLLISATGVHRSEGFAYGIDNGAWTAHQNGEDWDSVNYRGKFERLVSTHGARADWIVLPDIVCGGLASLERSLMWLETLRQALPEAMLLIPVQNGMETFDVEPWLDAHTGVFVGGDTRWKEQTMHVWGQLCGRASTHLHVGRVNTRRRIKLCAMAGAASFDGTSASRYAVSLPGLDAEVQQCVLKL